jgi:ferredoxin
MRANRKCITPAIALAALTPAAALAEGGSLAQLRPTFTETGHEPPPTAQPAPRAGTMAYVDVGVLLLALCAASFIALRLRSRRWMVALAIFSGLYFGFYRLGCICPVGSVQNMAEALAGRGYTVPLSVVLVFALPLVFTLFFGRTFCAAVCPLGVLQELVVIRPRRLPLHIRRPLELLPWLYLAVAVVMAAAGGGYLICRYDPFIGIYRLGGPLPILLSGALLLAVGTVIGRPYCRFLCPYGALLGLCSRVSRRHVTITPANCVQCRLCENACPYDAILIPTPAKAPVPRARGIRRLVVLLALAPLLIGGGGWIGTRLAVPLSRFADAVNLAEQVHFAEQHPDAPPSVEVDGFRRTREDPARLYERALAIRQRLQQGGGWIGAFTGLVLASSLFGLAIRRTRSGYVPDRAQCVSCTRCFSSCPVKPPPPAVSLTCAGQEVADA